MQKRRILVGKVDLDTVGAAFLLKVTTEDEIELVHGNTAPCDDLNNPHVVCIEVGGSGQHHLGNWDHHEIGGPNRSATYQVWHYLQRPAEVKNLAEYIDIIDTKGPRSLPCYGKVRPPTLSDVISGMFLIEHEEAQRVRRGVEILKWITETGINPFGTISGFGPYARAKIENSKQVRSALKHARLITTRNGLRLGYLETPFYGAVGSIYGIGAQVAIAFNPNYNRVRKFTVAGNDIRVDDLLQQFDALEPGWGGSSTGTIIGSPRSGSNLSPEEVIKIAERTL